MNTPNLLDHETESPVGFKPLDPSAMRLALTEPLFCNSLLCSFRDADALSKNPKAIETLVRHFNLDASLQVLPSAFILSISYLFDANGKMHKVLIKHSDKTNESPDSGKK